MSVKWLAVIGLVALPMLAQAECGWLLMIPESLGAGAALPPFSSWRQAQAFDSARECQDVVSGVAKAETIGPLMRRVRIGEFDQLTAGEKTRVTFLWGRCLPASQVPVR